MTTSEHDDEQESTPETPEMPRANQEPPGGDDVRVGPEQSDEPEAGAAEPAD